MNVNQLYPVFFKMDQFTTLVVGGGNVGLEKLGFLLKSSPNAKVDLVAIEVHPQIEVLADSHVNVRIIRQQYEVAFLQDKQLLIVATENRALNKSIWYEAKQRGIFVNVADTPALCDFYLGSIITKGDLKIAISTNGKSPTFAKRFRELLEAVLPEELPELLNNLRVIRDRLEGSFSHKVKTMNQLTADLIKE